MRFPLRLTTLGVLFVLMFSVIGLRLWFVQVANPVSAQAAEAETWLEKTTHAPRGDIFDRNGILLATSRLVPAVYIDRTFVQPDDAPGLIERLASMVGLDPQALAAAYEEEGINARVFVATVNNETAYMINEHLAELPGVEIVKEPERVYLAGPTLAHVIGHLGLPSDEDLEEDPDLDPNVRIGKLGVERSYDAYLQGTSGWVEYRVRRGQVIDQRPPVEPIPGDSVVLTLDLDLQQVVELALEEGIVLSNAVKDLDRAEGKEIFSVTERAAAVVLDVDTFEVLALASYPDFDPQLFVGGIDSATFEDLNKKEVFNDLAIAGGYPPASTFKAITYVAAEEERLPFPQEIEGVDGPNRLVHCDGKLVLPDLADGSPQVKTDWYNPADKGWLNIHGALEQSCNIYFWSVALGTWQRYQGTESENILQDWAKDLGYGSRTGIDLGAEISGQVPTRELFEELAAYQRENPDEPPRLDPSRLELASPWVGGDLMDFAIGQGAFTATPLQVATSYAVIANGGEVMEPRVVKEIVNTGGDVMYRPPGSVIETLDISPLTWANLMADLNRVVVSGTARQAFEDFGPGLERVGGKTGTGQAATNQDNHAWFAGVAPIDNPRYVVVVLIDEGGSGGRVAAPVARHIMQYLMGNVPSPIVAGEEAQ